MTIAFCIVILLLLCLSIPIHSWSIISQLQATGKLKQQQHQLYNNYHETYTSDCDNNNTIRRKLFHSFTAMLTSSIVWNSYIDYSNAVVMEGTTSKIFTPGEALDTDVAKVRFQDAYKTLNNLLDNYESISALGGDNVRRYLGTVGTTSSLYGIMKVLKVLQDDATDLVEYRDSMEDFDYWLQAAETAAYSAIFVEYSAAKTKPEKFLNDARIASERMKESMKKMAFELRL